MNQLEIIQKLKDALRFYANEDRYFFNDERGISLPAEDNQSSVQLDLGETARKALRAIE